MLKPSNVLVDPHFENVHLIDFGIAARVLKDGSAAVSPAALEGTLAYLAPEQTGRVNRGIDERTDLYSLGVTLYEMLTGVLPFAMSDPVELLHSHIARTPLPPHTLRPAVPEVLSSITLKLMSKMAEDRYQSASGLRADLETCLQSWRSEHHILAFPLGRFDRSSELRLPQKLYGRKSEQAELNAALERVRSGALELILVAGAAGLGKTELVSELAQPLAQHGGYLARVRFDQQHQGIPYGPLLRACRELLRLLLTEPPLGLQTWKQRFLSALGSSAQILIELLPELEHIIGKQPKVTTLSPVESQNRFGLLFQNFLRQFASAEHPLVLFLDDMHWADAASLQLVRLLLTDPFGHYMLVVGSYREQELHEAHPLHAQRESLRKERVKVTILALEPLALADVLELLAATLATDPQELTALAQEVWNKTYGNPFFVGQFLRGLYRDQLLTRSAESLKWQWDLGRIQALTATDNVADFMAVKVQRLGPQALHLVQAAACVGSQFDLHTVAQLGGVSPTECARGLAEAVQAGLLTPLDNTYHLAGSLQVPETSVSDPVAPDTIIAFKFPHERVQQAAYATIGEGERQELHLRLGQLRLKQWGKDAPTSRLFDLVSHLNSGSPRLQEAQDQSALLALAELNLNAGLRAKATAAYQAAVGFFTAGTQLLPESAWESSHALLFQLYLERAHCESLNGRFGEAEALLAALRQRTRVPIEQSLVQLRWCELCYARGDYAESTQLGITGLAYLGIPMPGPGEDAFAAFLVERAEIDRLLAGRSPLTMASLPLLQNPEIELAVQLIVALSAPAYVAGSPLYALLMARPITLALRYGVSEQTSYACSSYAFLLATVLGEPAIGAVFGQLALDLNARLMNASMACRIRVAIGAYAHLCMPIKAGIAHLTQGCQEGLTSGDFAFLSMSCSNIAQLCIFPSEDLSVSLREVEEFLALMQRTKDALSTLQITQIRQLLRALLGRTREPTSLSDPDFDEAAEWQSVQKGGAGYAKLLFAEVKLVLLNLFGKYEEACALGTEAEQWFVFAPGLAFQAETVFLICLALLGRYPAVAAAERPEYDQRIEKFHAQLRIWRGHCPENYTHRERLIAAERARLNGQSAEAVMLYDESISAAHRNGFPLHEALAHELAGRFHAAADRGKLASYYLTEALYAYLHLGATAKASVLIGEHPGHLRAETRALQGMSRPELSARGTTSNSSTSSHHTTDDHLDVNSVLRASEVISRERAIDKVIEQVLYTVLTSAAAQRGFLILDRGGTLQIEAARTISPDSSQTGLSIPLDGIDPDSTAGQELPLSVIHYVVRTREVVVLSDAVADHRFPNDAYLIAAKPRALLCLPLVSQGRLTGILYLENNVTQVTFSPSRIDLLRILAAQAATALENALLIHRISEATEKVHRTNEVLEAQVAERTAEIQRSNTELQSTNRRLQVELTERTRAERERAELQDQMLQAQRERLAEMSTPLIPITARIMVMPLIGTMDSERAAQILEVALGGAQNSRAQVVIIDITGLRHIDTSIADSLLKTARALRLLGAHAILTGIRAVVAQTLVGLGVDLNTLETRSTLQSAIAYALRYTGESL